MSFDHQKAIKGFGAKRPENVRYEPVVGSTWTYFDAEGEGVVQWLVEELDGSVAVLKKMSGRSIGYKARYEVEKLAAKRWKPLDETAAIAEVLWPCPHCAGSNPIRVGDYVCVVCRDALDNES